MYKINKKATKEQWVSYTGNPSVEFLIKPLSLYYFKKLPSSDNLQNITAGNYLDMVCQLIVDWKGIYDQDEKIIDCTDENKKMIVDYDSDIASFIIQESGKLRSGVLTKGEEVKN